MTAATRTAKTAMTVATTPDDGNNGGGDDARTTSGDRGRATRTTGSGSSAATLERSMVGFGSGLGRLARLGSDGGGSDDWRGWDGDDAAAMTSGWAWLSGRRQGRLG